MINKSTPSEYKEMMKGLEKIDCESSLFILTTAILCEKIGVTCVNEYLFSESFMEMYGDESCIKVLIYGKPYAEVKGEEVCFDYEDPKLNSAAKAIIALECSYKHTFDFLRADKHIIPERSSKDKQAGSVFEIVYDINRDYNIDCFLPSRLLDNVVEAFIQKELYYDRYTSLYLRGMYIGNFNESRIGSTFSFYSEAAALYYLEFIFANDAG